VALRGRGSTGRRRGGPVPVFHVCLSPVGIADLSRAAGNDRASHTRRGRGSGSTPPPAHSARRRLA
jgi:hypothetical protein